LSTPNGFSTLSIMTTPNPSSIATFYTRQFPKMLDNLGRCLDKGAAHADIKKFESAILCNSRLAPDQFNLIRQVQIACDNAAIGAARLAGRDLPKFPDEEKSLPELKTRLEKTIAYLKTFNAKDFEGAELRKITQPRWNGKTMNGYDFFHQVALPNFFFHVTTAYSILRHNGVDIGKADYLGHLELE
jgi:hypothetical protein